MPPKHLSQHCTISLSSQRQCIFLEKYHATSLATNANDVTMTIRYKDDYGSDSRAKIKTVSNHFSKCLARKLMARAFKCTLFHQDILIRGGTIIKKVILKM